MTDEPLEQAKLNYIAGQQAFERGQYRQSVEYLETATALIDRPLRLKGEMQIWLITAYQANGQQDQAIALCRRVSRHPNYETAKQGKRLLYILEAPELRSRPEWLTQIPDLTDLDDSTGSTMARYADIPKKVRSPKPVEPAAPPPPVDPSQVNTQDNSFIWLALVAIAFTLGGLLWFS
ncbi:MAG: hypothetical protein WBA57_09600 [Elainellaceae cyanobacterium]